MKKALLTTIAVMALFCGAMLAQQSGTINTLSLNPRQNQELTNTTGTESGQPSDAVPGSENEPNGLVPATTNMAGSGSNGNTNQTPSAAKSANATSAASAEPARAAEKKTTGTSTQQTGR